MFGLLVLSIALQVSAGIHERRLSHVHRRQDEIAPTPREVFNTCLSCDLSTDAPFGIVFTTTLPTGVVAGDPDTGGADGVLLNLVPNLPGRCDGGDCRWVKHNGA
jgi:hypothetical protein